MRFKGQFTIVNHFLKLFFTILALFGAALFGLVCLFTIDLTAFGTGVVKSAQWTDVKPQIGGIIIEMNVEEGQKVNKNDILFILEDRERKSEVEKSQLSINELNNRIIKLKNELLSAQKDISASIMEAQAFLETAQTNFNMIRKGPKPQEIKLAKSKILRANKFLAREKMNYERMEKGFSLKLVSKLDLDRAFYDMTLSQIDLTLAKDELALLQNKYDTDQVAIANSAVEQKKASLAKALARQIEIDSIRQDLNIAISDLDKEINQLNVLKQHLLLTRVAAPIDGFVLTHDTEHLEGKAIGQGESVLRLGDSNEYIIDCIVSERDFPLVKPGQCARVNITPFPKGEYQLFQARVLTVGADIKKSDSLVNLPGLYFLPGSMEQSVIPDQRYFPVILKLDKPYSMVLFGNRYEIKPGFSAQVEIILEKERISTFFIRRLLRIKGTILPEKIHL